MCTDKARRFANEANRRTADAQIDVLYLRVVNAIKGDAEHGDNSALYRALGYKTKSEWKTGLTKKVQPSSPEVK